MDKGQEASQPPSYTEATNDQQGFQGQYPGQYPPQGQYSAQGQYPPQGQGQYSAQGQGQYPPQDQGQPGQGKFAPQEQYPQYPPPPGQGPPGYSYPTQYGAQTGQPGCTYSNVVVTQPMMTPAISGPAPPDHMCAAIFVTLCCFWPTGVIAIIKASEVRSSLARGDLLTAQASSRSAKQMVTISIIVGVISFILIGALIGVYIGFFLSNFDTSTHLYD